MNQIYGLAPALEALRARRRKIHKILIASGAHQARLNELVEAARRAGVAVEKCDRRELDELTRHANHQGVVASSRRLTGRAHTSRPKRFSIRWATRLW